VQANWLLDDLAFDFERAASTPEVSSWPEVLGVSRQASPEEIKSAFRNAVKTYHPDLLTRFGPKLRQLGEEETRRITAAFEQAKLDRGF
jgi:DnaJ-domain-containing protein 1